MSLGDLLRRRIEAQGPISVAEYMAECLLHPEFGYYTTQTPFGAKGDFTTAPEISQMFGELVGLSLAQCWLDQGQPSPVTLAELGPGRGTLMSDILRATKAVPGFHAAVNVTLVEASDALKTVQQDTLAPYQTSWAKDVNTLPEAPLYLVANEFFDALPIRQFERSETGWRERQIGAENGALVFGLGPELPQPALHDRLSDTDVGDVVEYAPAIGPIISEVSQRIDTHGGAALIIDYGDWRSLGDTLQAVKAHEPTHPLQEPGLTDLTAHVDFEALARAAVCAHSRLTPQGVFLERLGITQRARQLAERMDGAELTSHIAAHRRLTHPNEMGNLFKVLGLFPARASPPPGLDT